MSLIGKKIKDPFTDPNAPRWVELEEPVKGCRATKWDFRKWLKYGGSGVNHCFECKFHDTKKCEAYRKDTEADIYYVKGLIM